MNEELIQRLEIAVKRLETIVPHCLNNDSKLNLPGNVFFVFFFFLLIFLFFFIAQSSTEIPLLIQTYDDMIERPLKNFISLCTEIGDDVSDAVSFY